MYGHHVHEAVIQAYRQGEIKYSEVCMHFVTEEYDQGPVFFRYPILIRPDDDADSLGSRVNKIEHGWQSFITNLVVHRQIYWDGKNHNSLRVPAWYKYL
jgi:phosphoribosylglycinamide formyltransferase-1